MQLEDARILENREVQGEYMRLALSAPGIAPKVKAGQFVHLRIPRLDPCVLRRPFSVFDTQGGTLVVLYKEVGRGTHAMKGLQPGETASLLGPLGNGFPAPGNGRLPVLVAGGYGMAALYLLAKGRPRGGIAFVGGASKADILCVQEFQQAGWDVRVATEDGSLGTKGLVTGALDTWLKDELKDRTPEFFACGPNAMLKAVGERAARGGWTAWLSMDRHMGCGVGACLTCVQKIRTADGGWTWERVCREGPVFEAKAVVWEGET